MNCRETALYHTVAYTTIRRPNSAEKRIYVLFVLTGDQCMPVAMMPLVEYILEHGRTRSLAWQRELTRSVGLFVDYLKANEVRFQASTNRPQVLAEFVEALVGGTIRRDGEDPSGLYWEPKSPTRSTVHLNAVTGFGDWLVQQYDTTPINPWRESTMSEKIAYWRRFDKRKAGSLLAHTYDHGRALQAAAKARTVRVLRKSISHDTSAAKHFPDSAFLDLLQIGFRRRGNEAATAHNARMNIRDMMITILMHAGGLRESEPFHLFVSDVLIDPHNAKSALVRLYHPEYGAAPADFLDPITNRSIKGTREQYLKAKWDLEPRNLVAGRFHAGWKDLKMSNGKENYTVVHWFPSFWGEIFLALFKTFITKVRSRHAAHPYLFVSTKESVDGDPYTIDSYRQSHAKAVRRIGLPVGKDYGTTPHGHRHAYAQRLTDAGLAEEVIQATLHHKSRESQQVYNVPTSEKVRTVLAAASEAIQSPPAVAGVWTAAHD